MKNLGDGGFIQTADAYINKFSIFYIAFAGMY